MSSGPNQDRTAAREGHTVEIVSSDGYETGRRISAALALAGRTADEVAPELNISPRTLKRVIGGERHAREWEIRRLAEILPVPEWFLREGFAGQPTADELRDRDLAHLEQLILELGDRIEALTGRSGDAAQGELTAVAPEDRRPVPKPGEGPAGLR